MTGKVFTGASPFKFLDPYSDDEEEYPFFFGRKEEETELYDNVRKTKVLLLYGISGSGKTSLLQCGLSHKFRMTTGWTPIFIRREHDINESFRKKLREKMDEIVGKDGQWQSGEIGSTEDLISSVKLLYGYTLRPVFLIFDQFEEFVLMSGDDEKGRFVDTLSRLFAIKNNPHFNVIILMREEYFGPFDSIMKRVPGIADWRMRLNPMKEGQVISVINDLLFSFKITLEHPEDDTKRIYNALKNSQGEVSLSNLQIYLDQFWTDDYKRTYPKGFPAGGEFPKLTFTTNEIKEFGTIDVVLQRFLINQQELLIKAIQKEYNNIPDDFLSRLLNEFITDEGAKNPQYFVLEEKKYYRFVGENIGKLNDFDKKVLAFTVQLLEAKRILRVTNTSMELSHDSLAKLIYDQQAARRKKQIRIRHRLNEVAEGGVKPIFHEVYGWNEYMDSSFFREEEIRLFENLRSEVNEKYIKANRSKAIRRIAFGSALVAVALLVFLFQNNKFRMRGKQDEYAIQFMQHLDTIRNTRESMILAKYFYDRLHDEKNQASIEQAMLKIANKPDYQRQFFSHEYSYKSGEYAKSFDQESVYRSLSAKGRYLLVNKIRADADHEDTVMIFFRGGNILLPRKSAFCMSDSMFMTLDSKTQELALCMLTDAGYKVKRRFLWNLTRKYYPVISSASVRAISPTKFIIPAYERNSANAPIRQLRVIDFADGSNKLFFEVPKNLEWVSVVSMDRFVHVIGYDKNSAVWLYSRDLDSDKIVSLQITGDNGYVSAFDIGKAGTPVVYVKNDSLYVHAAIGNLSVYPLPGGKNPLLYAQDYKSYFINTTEFRIAKYDLKGTLLKEFVSPFPIKYATGNQAPGLIVAEIVPPQLSGTRFVVFLDSALNTVLSFPKTNDAGLLISDNGDAAAILGDSTVQVYDLPGQKLAFYEFDKLNSRFNVDTDGYNDTLRLLKKKYNVNRPGFFD